MKISICFQGGYKYEGVAFHPSLIVYFELVLDFQPKHSLTNTQLILKWVNEITSFSNTGEVAFIVGGYASYPTSVTSSPSVEVYSPNGGCSYALAPLPYDLTDFSLFLYGATTILLCGGYSEQSRSWNRNCWRYDVPTNTWIAMTTYNNNHHRNTPFLTYQNKIYSFDYGGAEVYDPQTKVWSSGVTVPGNIGEGECGLLYKDSVFIFGGGGNVRYVQKYNFTTGMWTFPFTLNNGIFFSNCYLLPKTKGKVLIVAVDSGGTTTQTATIIDLETNQQTPIPYPNFLRGWGNSLVMLGTRLFVVNGWTWSANVPIVEEYHSPNNSWSKVTASMIYPRHRGGVIAVPASWFSNMMHGCKGVI